MGGDHLPRKRAQPPSCRKRLVSIMVMEARVAAIVASHVNPEWIVNLKESGQTWLVDYSNLHKKGRPLPITMIDTNLFLHDGGWAM